MLNFAIQRSRNAARGVIAAQLAVLILGGLSLGACSSVGSALSSLPKELGGMPEGTPERPATQLSYPAVHDMPPPREAAVLTPEQIKAAKSELTAVREGQPKGTAAAKKNRKKQEN